MCDNLVSVRIAESADLDFVSKDGYIPKDEVSWKIQRKECFVLSVDDQPVGYLRIEYLWSMLPFISLVIIQAAYRKRGYSRDLLGFVEEFLKEKGHKVLFSSSQADEPLPQAWHRHMGFEECGVINGVNAGGVGELFFKKEL
jgi:GNAT superfamily N-acetyltransferase